MQTLTQVEINDSSIIKSILDNSQDTEQERFTNLFTFYSNMSVNENYYFHLVVLADALSRPSSNTHRNYRERLTKKNRKDLFKLLIHRDMIQRKSKDKDILKEYLPYHLLFELSQQEIIAIAEQHLAPNLQPATRKNIDNFFKEQERGVSNKLGTSSKNTSDPTKLLTELKSPGEKMDDEIQRNIQGIPYLKIKSALVIRKKIIQKFLQSLSVAFKKDDNPGAGIEFNPIIQIINPDPKKNYKGLNADEVRVCLVIFFRLMKKYNLSKLGRHGERTMQVYNDLIEQGIRASKDDFLDDFVEVFYKLLITDLSPKVGSLDDLQLYHLSIQETVGAFSGERYGSNIEARVREQYTNRKTNIQSNLSMVHFLKLYYQNKNPGKAEIQTSDLINFDPASEERLHDQLETYVWGMTNSFNELNYSALILQLTGYRNFLTMQDSELKLFQILKWVANCVNHGLKWKGHDLDTRIIALELYLETYVSIIQYGYRVKKLLTYNKGLPKIDYDFFLSHIAERSWGYFKIDYLARLAYSTKYPNPAQLMIGYMLLLHTKAKKLHLELVPNTEREIVRKLRDKNSDSLNERIFSYRDKPFRAHSGTLRPVRIGDKFMNFKVYYISNPHELGDFAEDNEIKSNIDIETHKQIYLLHSQHPNHLFKFDNRFSALGNFLIGKMSDILYKNTRAVEIVWKHFIESALYTWVFIQFGPLALVGEIVLNKAAEKGAQILFPNSEVSRFVAELLLSLGGARVTPKLAIPRADKILRTQEITALLDDAARSTERIALRPIDDTARLVDDTAKLVDDTAKLVDDTHRTAQAAEKLLASPLLEKVISKIRIDDEFMKMHSGLTPEAVKEAIIKISQGKRLPPGWREIIEKLESLQKLILDADNPRFVRISNTQLKGAPYFYQRSSMGSDYEFWFTLDGVEYKLDGIILKNNKAYIGESKFTFKGDLEDFYLKGKLDPASSYHFGFLEESVIPQFEKYSKLAKKFGFEGVAVYTNTEFLWATFEQTTRHLENVMHVLKEFKKPDWQKLKRLRAGR